MNRILALGILLAATVGTYVFVAVADDPVSSERVTKLQVARADFDTMGRYVDAAARDLGYKHVRSYKGAVFIEDEAAHVNFFSGEKGFVMSVGFDTRYRLPLKNLGPALDDLQARGTAIWTKAQLLKEADKARNANIVASTAVARPEG